MRFRAWQLRQLQHAPRRARPNASPWPLLSSLRALHWYLGRSDEEGAGAAGAGRPPKGILRSAGSSPGSATGVPTGPGAGMGPAQASLGSVASSGQQSRCGVYPLHAGKPDDVVCQDLSAEAELSSAAVPAVCWLIS
jgi:hypothetical protein